MFVTLRHETRNRYMVIRIESDEQVARNALINALVKASNSVSATCYKEVAPWLTYFENNTGIVKFDHRHKDIMIGIVERIRLQDRGRKPMKVTALGVSGTINKARKKYIR